MAISMLDNLSIRKQAPDVERQLFNNIAEMARFNEIYLPDIYEANIKTDGSRWRFNRSNYIDPTTGKWRKIAEGGNGSSNYNELDNKPIINLTSSATNPIIVDTLEQGIYKINGQYKISSLVNTTFISMIGDLIYIDKTESNSISIKKVTSKDITNFVIDNTNNEVKTSKYLTEATLETSVTTYINKYMEEYEGVPSDEIDKMFD